MSKLHTPHVFVKSGSLNLPYPQGPVQACRREKNMFMLKEKSGEYLTKKEVAFDTS
jgi:hypothetical protein